ncbi:hypothetical protein A3J77_02025 [Candidatus Wolfebacteria bacterium RBG_13_41_7]|uniref:SMC-Scp complex subunit ScpB n=1 Tax=Candidatus Wolfebacteria bacterium RBG_13_41_7 TaxID=1802554 RepID=A0A1F8DNH0_9BACT|nr:MAG: hypothetical protein A3J77_02025 [Candidatus Wolfebacteria bacterium RBG_13_41_7]
MEENKKNITAEVEAFLFVYGEPLEVKKISKLLLKGANKVSEVEAKEVISELQKKYAESGGLSLLFSDSPAGQKVQLVTKPEFAPLMEDFIKDEFKEDLTPASLETLSLIAYLGPVSRAQIDYYRGVNSSFILRNLLMRGLVERYNDPQRANVYLYQASFDLLKYLGISKIEDLPEYEKFKTITKINNAEQPVNTQLSN